MGLRYKGQEGKGRVVEASQRRQEGLKQLWCSMAEQMDGCARNNMVLVVFEVGGAEQEVGGAEQEVGGAEQAVGGTEQEVGTAEVGVAEQEVGVEDQGGVEPLLHNIIKTHNS